MANLAKVAKEGKAPLCWKGNRQVYFQDMREEKELHPGSLKRGEILQRSQEEGGSDQALIAQAQNGDPRGMTALYGRYRVKMLNYLYRFTGDRARAEDLTQETFLRVVRYLPSYRPTGSVAGWIYRIAKNLALNELRRRKGHPELSLDEPVTYAEEEPMDRAEAMPGPQLCPDEESYRAEIGEAIQKALLQISPIYREVVILCDIQGHPYREAAEILRCSINTIASRLARGRARLADLLGYLKREI